MSEVKIRTADGTCDAYVAKPEGEGPFPPVLFFMDAPGVRDTLRAMADRVAALGFYVLLPNLYYRVGAYEPFDPATVFSGGAELERLMKLAETANDGNVVKDTRSFLTHFETTGEVKKGKVAVVGYCLGGGLALRMACEYPQSFAVAASFHGGRFQVTPEAPRMIADKAEAKVYMGVAEHDPRQTSEVTQKLADALAAAKIDHEIEVYPGAKHGFAVPDLPVYDPDHAAHHFRRLEGLLRPLRG